LVVDVSIRLHNVARKRRPDNLFRRGQPIFAPPSRVRGTRSPSAAGVLCRR